MLIHILILFSNKVTSEIKGISLKYNYYIHFDEYNIFVKFVTIRTNNYENGL
jgi:hypothetical protein